MSGYTAELVILGQLLLSAALGAAIGWERRYHHQIESQIRTFAAVAVGACAFGLVSVLAAGAKADPTRISASVVTGIGFLGAGMILHQQNRTTGLATAALLWATASVGLAIAHSLYLIGVASTIMVFAVRHFPSFLAQRYADDDKPAGTGSSDPPQE